MDRQPEEIIGLPPKPRPERPDPPYELEISVEEMGEELGALRLWPGGLRCEMSLASCAEILKRTGPPDRLEKLVNELRERGGLELLGEGAETLYWLAGTARSALDYLEDGGATFDFDSNVAKIPNDKRGRDVQVVTEAVGAAWEQLDSGRYSRDSTAAIRERLEGTLPPEELTHKKIKRRLQRYLNRRAAE